MAKKAPKKVLKKQSKQAQELKRKQKIAYIKEQEKIHKEREAALKAAIEFATERKQSGKPVNATKVVLKNSSDLFSSVLPDYMNTLVDLKSLLKSEAQSPLNKSGKEEWNSFWKSKKKRDANVANNILNSAIEESNIEEVAKRIQDNSDVIMNLAEKIMYDSKAEDIQQDIEEYTRYILGRALTTLESRTISQNLEKMQRQTVDDYILNNFDINPLTGKGITSPEDVVIPFRE